MASRIVRLFSGLLSFLLGAGIVIVGVIGLFDSRNQTPIHSLLIGIAMGLMFCTVGFLWIKIAINSSNSDQIEAAHEKPQAVIIHLAYGHADLMDLRNLENLLDKEVNQSGTGIYDGDEIATDLSDAFLYFYGKDADSIWKIIEPILNQVTWIKKAKITIGGREEEFKK